MKYLVCCPEPEDNGPGMYNRYTPNGATEHAYAMYFGEGDIDGGTANKRIRAWYVTEERSVQLVAEYLTRNFPGENVEVYQLQAVHTRPFGEMQTKIVDKNGILPKKA